MKRHSSLQPLSDDHPRALVLARRELAGGTVIWLFVAIELLTFGLFFVAFAAGRRADPASFAAVQAQLHPFFAAVNTCVLLTGGWFAARGVLANRCDEPRAASGYWWGVARCSWRVRVGRTHDRG